jgi:hypothetical protein
MHNVFVIIWYVIQGKFRESCISRGDIFSNNKLCNAGINKIVLITNHMLIIQMFTTNISIILKRNKH